MRKSLVLVSCLSLLMAGACNKFEAENSAAVENAAASGSTLMAHIPGATKTAFGETVGTETKMNWTEGDELYVFGESDWLTPHKYTLAAASAGSATGMFTSADPTTETGNIAAFYPYSWSNTYRNDNVNYISIPNDQNPATIGAGVMPMYGKGTVAEGLTFEHIGSLLRLKLYTNEAGKTLTGISVKNDKMISGSFHAFDDGRENKGDAASNSFKYVNYACEQPLSTDPSDPTVVDILIVAYGGVTLSNFSVSGICSDGTTFSKTMSGTKDVTPGSIVTFNALECTFASDLQISYDGGNNWVDYEGTVSIPDECTDIAVKSENTALTSLQVKTIKSAIEALPAGRKINLDLSGTTFETTTWPDEFNGAKKIRNIILPNNVKSIDASAFAYSSVQEVTIPAACTSVGRFPLRFTTGHFAVAEGNATYKTIDGSLYSYDGKNFVCADYSKSEITVAEGVMTIAQGAFINDESLQSLTLPSSLTEFKSDLGGMLYLKTIDASSLSTVPVMGNIYYDKTNISQYPGYAVSTDKKNIVAAGMVDAFSTTDGWKAFLTPTPAEGSYTSWTPWVITSGGL